MDAARQGQAESLFLAAREIAPQQRAGWLDQHCEDPSLRREVESLLAGDVDQPALSAGILTHVVGRLREPEALPDRLGPYRILRKLGEGSFGLVLLAEQAQPRRQVAVKLIKQVLDANAVRRFEYETEALGRLRHPGIAQILEAGSSETGAGTRHFFAMEFVEGVPLGEFVRQRQVPTRERIRLLSRVCAAVQHAHERGVIHRDLKPANILVTAAGDPKVIDFGLAKVLDSDVSRVGTATQSTEIAGTLAYMSPEQAVGDAATLDTRADVYALGVIGYELIAGRLPFDLRNRMLHEAVRVIREDDPVRLGSTVRSARGDLETIVEKAMAKDRARRYASAAELAADLERYLGNQPILARPPSGMYQLRKFVQRHRALSASGLAVVLSLALGLGVALQARNKADRRYEQLRQLGSLWHEFRKRARDLPGGSLVDAALLHNGIQHLEELARDADGSPSVLLDVATGYAAIADSQSILIGEDNPDEAGAAIVNFRKALEILSALSASGEATDVVETERVRVQCQLGYRLAHAGRSAEALELLSDAVDRTRARHARGPRTEALAMLLAYALAARGTVLVEGYRHDESRSCCNEALALVASLPATEPASDGRDRIELTVTMFDATLSRREQRTEAARSAHEKALTIAERCLTRTPWSQELLRTKADALEGLAQLQSADGQDDLAIGRFAEALVLRQTLNQAQPRSRNTLRALASTHQRMADAFEHAQRVDRALAELTTAIELDRELLTRDQVDVLAREDLAVTLGRLAQIRSRTGTSPAEVLPLLQEAVQVFAPLPVSDPGNLRFVTNLALARGELAKALGNLDRDAEALVEFERAELLTREGLERFPGNQEILKARLPLLLCTGGLLKKMVADRAKPAAERLATLRSQRRWFERIQQCCEAVPPDTVADGFPASIWFATCRNELRTCDDRIQALERSGAAASRPGR